MSKATDTDSDSTFDDGSIDYSEYVNVPIDSFVPASVINAVTEAIESAYTTYSSNDTVPEATITTTPNLGFAEYDVMVRTPVMTYRTLAHTLEDSEYDVYEMVAHHNDCHQYYLTASE